jgi:hypothetical protein
LSLELENA